MAVYALVLGPESPVRLLSVPMGQERRYGFGLFARQDIAAGTELWDVVGLMPTDDSDPHSDLSMITVAPGQNQRPGSSRVLFGPMRMLNHRCKTFNCEVCWYLDIHCFGLSHWYHSFYRAAKRQCTFSTSAET